MISPAFILLFFILKDRLSSQKQPKPQSYTLNTIPIGWVFHCSLLYSS